MSSLALVALPLLVALTSPVAATQPPGAAGQLSPARDIPAITLRLSTLVDHVELFGGQLVQLPPSRVSRVFSATLVELRDARERGFYRFHHPGHDRLLVVLPAGARVSEGDRVILEGRVRTVSGARITGELSGVSEGTLDDRRHDALVVATGVFTLDGVSLAGRR